MMILALDLGKFNTMCCFFDSETRKPEFIVAETQREYLTKIFKLKHVRVKLRPLAAELRLTQPRRAARHPNGTALNIDSKTSNDFPFG